MLYQTLTGLREKKNPDKKEQIVTEQDKIVRRWKKYFEELLGREIESSKEE